MQFFSKLQKFLLLFPGFGAQQFFTVLAAQVQVVFFSPGKDLFFVLLQFCINFLSKFLKAHCIGSFNCLSYRKFRNSFRSELSF